MVGESHNGSQNCLHFACMSSGKCWRQRDIEYSVIACLHIDVSLGHFESHGRSLYIPIRLIIECDVKLLVSHFYLCSGVNASDAQGLKEFPKRVVNIVLNIERSGIVELSLNDRSLRISWLRFWLRIIASLALHKQSRLSALDVGFRAAESTAVSAVGGVAERITNWGIIVLRTGIACA